MSIQNPDLATKPGNPAAEQRDGELVHDTSEFAFEERAAILEFEAGFPRDEAERRARAEVPG